ncbi:MAG: hypothetical protein M3328_14220, partial [Chloroflexota bacterium]|nr:hypothetical protein [Chloroflexota bacterium]
MLQEISQPFINLEVLALVRQGQPLSIDVDLTGRPVSPTSTTYPDADFGWMDAAVAKGYQAAITTVRGGPCGRLILSSQRYPGRTKSAECLRAAVLRMEQVLGVQPRRRPDLVQRRLTELTLQIAQRQALVEAARQRQQHLQRTNERVQAELIQRPADLAGHDVASTPAA